MSIVSQKKLKNNIYELENCQFKVIEIFYGNKMKRNEIEDLLAEYYILVLFNIIFTSNTTSIFHLDKGLKESYINHLYQTLDSGFLARAFKKVKKEKDPYLSAICNIVKKNKGQSGGGALDGSVHCIITLLLVFMLAFTSMMSINQIFKMECNVNPLSLKLPVIVRQSEYNELTKRPTIEKVEEFKKQARDDGIREGEERERGKIQSKPFSGAIIDAQEEALANFPGYLEDTIGAPMKGYTKQHIQQHQILGATVKEVVKSADEVLNEHIDDKVITRITNTLNNTLADCEAEANRITNNAGLMNTLMSSVGLTSDATLRDKTKLSEDDCQKLKEAQEFLNEKSENGNALAKNKIRQTNMATEMKKDYDSLGVKKALLDPKTETGKELRFRIGDKLKKIDKSAADALSYVTKGAINRPIQQQYINSSYEYSGTGNSPAIGSSQQSIAGFLSGGKRKLKVTKRMKTMKKKNRRTKKRSN